LDIAVKYLYFNHLLGGKDSDLVKWEELYDWHIIRRSGHRMASGITTDQWKATLDDYHKSAKELLESMQKDGFSPLHPIYIDNHGELLGGAHRLACALTLKMSHVPVEMRARKDPDWPPPWDQDWFIREECPVEIIRLLTQTLESLIK
jgi:hypothetical protein